MSTDWTKKCLILDVAPGGTLKSMVQKWRATMPHIQLVINNTRLPPADRSWLTQQAIQQVGFDPLNPTELLDHFKKNRGYPIIATRLNVPFKEPIMRELTSKEHVYPLQIIGQAGSTTSHIDLSAAKKYNVTVVCTPGANANAVADYVIAQIFNLTRSLIAFNDSSQKGVWSKYSIPPQEEFDQKTLGLIGYGHIAKAVSKKAQALGMKVIAFTRTIPKQADAGVVIVSSLETLLSKADIVSVHTSFTPATKGLIGAKEIGLMKQGAYLINTARGGIVSEEAIAKELRKPDSRLAGVAFDVFEKEGNDFSTPLIGTKAILTPHIAGSTTAALECAAVLMVSKIHETVLSQSINEMPEPGILKNQLFQLE